MHSPQNVLFRRYTHLSLLVVGQDNHVLALVPKMLHKVSGHVSHVVYTSPQLSSLSKVVDAYEESFPPTRALGVLVRVALRCSMSKGLGPVR
jgi:hypothetical protein